MDAAMVTALAALLGAPVAAAAAVYGSRAQNRAAREGHVITGYDSLTAKLAAERDKAEADQAAAEAKAAALELEVARLRLLVTQLGGTP
ncbi:hypothetical protein HHX38_08320 [Streptomyces sp. PKU-MA01144]|uniref:hypothetical protein n=1 Tax=Streptomyces sp. PKU-MA01144 TaxID=2729138 RepID=UPI00147C55A3|nr:hypothetical protein [Streptomyces sp. PKU-MA01144]NNJ04138.1 hypothetical protein [Streptomyces sp. PKU-MA01144]